MTVCESVSFSTTALLHEFRKSDPPYTWRNRICSHSWSKWHDRRNGSCTNQKSAKSVLPYSMRALFLGWARNTNCLEYQISFSGTLAVLIIVILITERWTLRENVAGLTIPSSFANDEETIQSIYHHPYHQDEWKNAGLRQAFALPSMFRHSGELSSNIQMLIAVAEHSPLVHSICPLIFTYQSPVLRRVRKIAKSDY